MQSAAIFPHAGPTRPGPALAGAAALLFLAATVAPATGADWPQWRGPARNGLAPESPPLLAGLSGNDLPPLWASEPIQGGDDGGFGSPVVAGDRVYVYVCWRTYHPITHRVLTKETLGEIGAKAPSALTPELAAKIDAASIDPALAKLSWDDRSTKVEAWATAEIPAPLNADKDLVAFVRDRFNRGAKALPPAVLDQLYAIQDRRFETAADLDAWAKEAGLDATLWEKTIRPKIPDRVGTEEDVVLCLDAQTGAPRWRFANPSRAGRWSASSTPCVAGDQVFVLGAAGTAYCLDAATGKEVWRRNLGKGGAEREEFNSSFLHHDGTVYVLANRLVALAAATGEVRWEQPEATGRNASPVLWASPDGPVLIGGEFGKRCAVDPGTGRVLWTVAVPGPSTPAIVGDRMALAHKDGTKVFALARDGARELGASKLGAARASSPLLLADRVLAGGKQAAAIAVAGGQTLWEGPSVFDDVSSGVAADGKLFLLGRKRDLCVFDAATGKELWRAAVDYLKCASPCLADGRLYLRTAKGVSCFDLRAAKP